MGRYIDTMFNGFKFMPTKLYWCEINQQIVERWPEMVKMSPIGIYGYTYNNIRKSMKYIGKLD